MGDGRSAIGGGRSKLTNDNRQRESLRDLTFPTLPAFQAASNYEPSRITRQPWTSKLASPSVSRVWSRNSPAKARNRAAS